MPSSKEDIQRFLHYISQLESSGGKDTKHKTVQSGLLKGETAVGPHALMPSTKTELLNRYPASLNEESSPEEFDKKLAEHVLSRTGGDETAAAGLWRHGHNKTSDKFEDLRDTKYAQAYDKMRSQIPYALDSNPYQQEYANNNLDETDMTNLGKKITFPSLKALTLKKP